MDDWRIEYALCRRGRAGVPGGGGCGYDLRMLRAWIDDCPECGWAVRKTLVAVADEAQSGALVWGGEATAHPGVLKLAARTVYPRETLELLIEARRFVFAASRLVGATPVEPSREAVSPAAQCRGLRDHFRICFGEDAGRELIERRLLRSDQVCGVIQQLAAFGVLTLGSAETVSGYHDASCPDPMPGFGPA